MTSRRPGSRRRSPRFAAWGCGLLAGWASCARATGPDRATGRYRDDVIMYASLIRP